VVTAGGAALAVAAVAVVAARRVDVVPPTPPPAVAQACRALQPLLPADLDGQPRRATAPDSDLTAAWGDPAMVLRCGVPVPATLELTSELVTVDGVDWFPEPIGDGYVFTTTRRAASVELRVPAAYAPEVNPLTDLAEPIERSIAVLPR
jgi:hypothetical protein